MERSAGLSVRSIYIGGGTPTLLPTGYLLELLKQSFACFSVQMDAEITIEANPGTVDLEKLSALREAGVNRLSFGAQAKQAHLLETLGRIHRWEDVEATFAMARAARFENINLDVMYGLPGQTPSDFRETLEAALALSPEHLSAYSLILEEDTPFFARYDGHPELLPTEEQCQEMADDVLWMTAEAGLSRYEISNFAPPGRQSQHNRGYWLREDYLGIGVSAHSLMGNRRFANPSSIDAYLRGEREKPQVLTPEEACFERLMMGLRLVEGIQWGDRALLEPYKEKFRLLRSRGLLDFDSERIWLTERGLDLQNLVLVDLMD